jgi:hypothetical protein
MAALEDIKELKGWQTDSSHDGMISIFIRRAVTLIKNHLNLSSNDTTDIETVYQDAVVCFVMEQLNMRGNEGMKQFAQGGRSGTYNSGLSKDVKSLLPVPSAKLLG